MNERTTPDMELARAAMDARHRPLDARRKAAVWAGIEAARVLDGRAWPWARWAWIGAAAVASAVAVLLSNATPAAVLRDGELRAAGVVAPLGVLPTRVPLEAAGRATLGVGGGDVTLAPGARLVVDDATRTLVLEAGALTFAGEAAGWSLMTDEAWLAWTGARVQLARTARGTRVEVESGVVQLEARGGGRRRVRAGEAVEVVPRVVPGMGMARGEAGAADDAVPLGAEVGSGVGDTAAGARGVDAAGARGVASAAASTGAVGRRRDGRGTADAQPHDVDQGALGPEDDHGVPAAAGAAHAAHRPPGATVASATDEVRALEEARRVAPSEPARARLLAQGVLDAHPRPDVRVEAQMVVADALRRQGDREGAARMYDRVASSADAGPFLEEALFREAQLLTELARTDAALVLLDAAERARPAGLLRPERVALTASLYLGRGEVDRAARVLEDAADVDTLATQRARIEVGRLLVDRAPERAARLVGPALHSASPDVVARARQIAGAIPPGSVPKIADPATRR